MLFRSKFSAKCQLTFYHTNGGVMIATPGGRVATYQLNRRVPIKLGSLEFKTTLLIMGLESVDIVLGTDLLSRPHALIDVAARAIEIHSPFCGDITLYLPNQGCTHSCALTEIESPVERHIARWRALWRILHAGRCSRNRCLCS